MKLSLNMAIQIVATIGQMFTACLDIVPLKYKAYVMAIIGVCQVLVSRSGQLNFNADGTPATEAYVPPPKPFKMPGIFLALLFVPLLTLNADAQTLQGKFAFGGVGYFEAPKVQGFMGLAVPIGLDGKMYSWTDADFSIVKSGGALTVGGQGLQYSMKSGIAYKIDIGPIPVFLLGAPGLQTDGSSISARASYGIALHRFIYKDRVGILLPLTAETHIDPASGNVVTNFAPRIGLNFKF